MNYYIKAFENYFKFTGRASRSEYWYFVLFNAIVIAFLIVGFIFVDGSFYYAYIIYALAALFPSLGLLVRRLHDVNKSGWWFFISLIPFVGAIWLLVLLCLPSVNEGNQY